MENRVIHFEYHSADPVKTQSFFEKVFGWKHHKWEGPWHYWLVMTGEKGPGINGGLMQSQDGQPRTVNTISVDSVDAFVQKVTDAGGQIAVPKMAIPGVGWVAYCVEPMGNLFGIHQEDPSAK